MCSLLGGYVVEELFFGEMTTGASNDLGKATNIARRMVTEYGMSTLGPVIYGDQNQEVFLGRDFGHVRNYSEEIAATIDQEIKKFIDTAYNRTKKIVLENKETIERIAHKLIQKETLNKKDFIKLFENKETKDTKKKQTKSKK